MPIGKRAERLLLSKKAITRTHAIAIVIILVVAIAAAYFATRLPTLGPGGGSNGNGSSGNGNGEPQPPDLIVSDISSMPFPPKVGETFYIQVLMTNIGEAKSGPFDLQVWIDDLSHTYTYLVGEFSQNPMEPGEERFWGQYIQAANSLKWEGGHRFCANIEPIGFEEDESNNLFQTQSFWVSKP
jgi:hypothetical protein